MTSRLYSTQHDGTTYTTCPSCNAEPPSLPLSAEYDWTLSATLTLHQSTCTSCGSTITLAVTEHGQYREVLP